MMAARRGVTVVRQIVSFARGVTPGSVPWTLDPSCTTSRGSCDTSCLDRFQFSRRFRRTPGVRRRRNAALSDVLNLCVNARDAMPHGGTLTLDIQAAELPASETANGTAQRYVVITVKDTGVGIAADKLETIFEPFLRPSPPATARAWDRRLPHLVAEWAASCVLQARSARAPNSRSIGRSRVPERGRARRPGGPRRTRPGRRQRSFLRRTGASGVETYGYRTAMAHDAGEALAHLVARGTEVNVVVIDGATSLTAQEVRAARARACVVGLGSVSDCTVCIEKPYSADDLLRAVSRGIGLSGSFIMTPSIRLLIVDDDELLRQNLVRRYRHLGMTVSDSASAEDLLSRRAAGVGCRALGPASAGHGWHRPDGSTQGSAARFGMPALHRRGLDRDSRRCDAQAAYDYVAKPIPNLAESRRTTAKGRGERAARPPRSTMERADRVRIAALSAHWQRPRNAAGDPADRARGADKCDRAHSRGERDRQGPWPRHPHEQPTARSPHGGD